MRLVNAIERFSENRRQVDLWSAVAAGLWAGILSSLSHALDHPVRLSLYAADLILAVGSYLTVAYLINRFGKVLLKVIPSWLVIASLGSALYIVMDLARPVISRWAYVEQSFVEYFSYELYIAAYLIVSLALITMPITALIYYAGSIVRGVIAWHNGPETPSILRGPHGG
jgi:hypothetical protein